MPTTRSKSRYIRHPSGSPLKRRSPPRSPPRSPLRFPPHKKAKPPAPPVLRTFCQHGPPGDCTCGSDFRPRNPASYTTGRTPASNAVSEAFLQSNLGITASELTYIICISMELKDALVVVTTSTNAHLEYWRTDRHWRVVDEAGQPVAWLARAAELLKQRQIISEFHPRENEVDINDPNERMPVDRAIINLQNAKVDVKTVLGRAWLCYGFVPAVMQLLQEDTFDGDILFAKLMRADNTDGVRAYLLYQAIKAGLGEVAARRQDVWERILSRRSAQLMTRRLEELENTKNAAEQEERTGVAEFEILRKELQELRETVQKEPDAITKLAITKLAQEVKENQIELKQSMITLQKTQASDIARLTTDLQGTRELLTTDQIQSRAWMREAVDNIRTTILTARAPAAAPDLAAGPPLLFLRMRNPGNDIKAENYTRVYSAGESTFAVARGLLRPFTTPFMIAIMGYSNAGKSYTVLGQDGVIAAVLGRMSGDVDVKVYQVLHITESIGDFAYPHHTISNILAGITKARTTAQTPANETSSRAHMMVTFENAENGAVLGTVIDVAGAEESANRDLLEGEMKRTSAAIAVENAEFRKLLLELGTSGKEGFISRKTVSEVKRSSPLNLEVAKFLACVKGEPALRILLCVDGSRPDMFGRALSLVPVFPEVAGV